MPDDSQDPAEAKALARYQVISAYLALDPPRGQRRQLLEQLAAKSWVGAGGEIFQVSAETIRKWVARYRDRGLGGLRDKPHPLRGTQALTPEQIELVCKLRREVPERSLDRLIRIELRYDPEMLDLIEVWHKGQFIERIRPFEVQTHRRPKPVPKAADEAPAAEAPTLVADYLGHLVNAQRKEGRVEPSPQALAAAARAERAAADDAVCELLADKLDPAVVDEPVIRDYCVRLGPFDVAECELAIAPLLARGLTDHHITIYLDAIARQHRQGQQP